MVMMDWELELEKGDVVARRILDGDLLRWQVEGDGKLLGFADKGVILVARPSEGDEIVKATISDFGVYPYGGYHFRVYQRGESVASGNGVDETLMDWTRRGSIRLGRIEGVIDRPSFERGSVVGVELGGLRIADSGSNLTIGGRKPVSKRVVFGPEGHFVNYMGSLDAKPKTLGSSNYPVRLVEEAEVVEELSPGLWKVLPLVDGEVPEDVVSMRVLAHEMTGEDG
jgi:hypothetical protein